MCDVLEETNEMTRRVSAAVLPLWLFSGFDFDDRLIEMSEEVRGNVHILKRGVELHTHATRCDVLN